VANIRDRILTINSSDVASYAGMFTDLDAALGDVVTITAGPVGSFSFNGLPWIVLDKVASLIRIQTTFTSAGNYRFRVEATDLANNTASKSFSVSVIADIASTFFNETTNETEIDYGRPPEPDRAELSPLGVRERTTAAYRLPFGLFVDPDGRPMKLVMHQRGGYGLPSFISFVNDTVFVNASTTRVGTYPLSVYAYNNLGLFTSIPFAVVVQNVNGTDSSRHCCLRRCARALTSPVSCFGVSCGR
jgi:hypothetical protein